jgi:hypothetical protein
MHGKLEDKFNVMNKISEKELLENKKRTFIISVERAISLKPNSNSFVYFSFNKEDFYTDTVPGSNPRYNK